MHATPARTKPIKGQKNRSDSFTPLIMGSSTRTHMHAYTHTQPLLIGSCPSVGEAFIPGYMDDGANTWGPLFICPAQVAELTCCLPACLSTSLYLPPSVCFCLSLFLSDDSQMMQVETLQAHNLCFQFRWLSVRLYVCAFTHICSVCGQSKWSPLTCKNNTSDQPAKLYCSWQSDYNHHIIL